MSNTEPTDRLTALCHAIASGRVRPHALATTEFVPADPETGSIDGWKAICTCSYSMSTSLGASSYNRTDRFARELLHGHLRYMNGDRR